MQKENDMTVYIVILSSMMFWFLSCADGSRYGGGLSSNPGYTFNSDSGPNGSCSAAGQWGGVSCLSGTNKDTNFLDFLSNGTDLTKKNTIGDINCTPSNNGGILIRMKVDLNAQINTNGNNQNLVMQPTSTFEITVYDTFVEQKDKDPIGASFNGLKGTINGNKADLEFVYTGKAGWKKIRLTGSFNAQVFNGTIYFENEQYFDGRRPGAKGTLGNFKIATCTAFTSN